MAHRDTRTDRDGDRTIVGRDRELGEARAMLGRIGPGGDGLVVLGEAGVGKSTLTDAIDATARASGFAVGRGWCSAVDMPPYWPWRRLLRDVSNARPFDEPAGPTGPDRDSVR